jgi:hypothetical protein
LLNNQLIVTRVQTDEIFRIKQSQNMKFYL